MVLKHYKQQQCKHFKFKQILIWISGWAWGAGIMGVSIVSFMFLDIVKVLLIRNWSFELTARLWPSPKNREKLRKRKERASMLERFNLNLGKVKKAVLMSGAAMRFKQATEGKKLTIFKSQKIASSRRLDKEEPSPAENHEMESPQNP